MVVAEPNLPLRVLLPDLALGLLQVHVLPARLVDPYMALDLLQDQVQVLSAFVDTT